MPDALPSLPFVTRPQLSFGGQTTFQLRVEVLVTSTEEMILYGMTREGIFTFSLVPSGAGGEHVFTLAIPDVPIWISLSKARADSAGSANYAEVSLMVDGNRSMSLCQGIIHQLASIAWPHHLNEANVQEDGEMTVIDATPAGANTEVSLTVPDHQIWEITGILLGFTADANAADRTINLFLTPNGASNLTRAGAATIQATEIQELSFIPGGTTAVITANTRQEIALPQRVVLRDGDTITTTTTNFQTGDIYDFAIIGIFRKFQRGAT